MLFYDDLGDAFFELDRSALRVMTTDEAWAEKEYEHYLHMTPAQRIACGEHLRRAIYGEDAVNARIQGVLELVEREAP